MHPIDSDANPPSYTDFAHIDVEVLGGSAEPYSVLRTVDTYDGTSSFASTGFDIERVRFAAAGVEDSELVERMSGSAATSYFPLWLDEIEPGRVAVLYRHEEDAIDEIVYRDNGLDSFVPLPEGVVPDKVRRTGDGTLWLSNRDEAYLYRWSPGHSGPAEPIAVPSPTIDATWLAGQGFFQYRAQLTTVEPDYPAFEVPVAYETLHFTGTGVALDAVALTPCVHRAACREIGESELSSRGLGRRPRRPRALRRLALGDSATSQRYELQHAGYVRDSSAPA